MHRASLKRAAVLLTTALAATQAVSVARANTAAPATPVTVTCGEVITASITVANDLTCAGNALQIAADNVTVNLAGHTITGGGTGIGVLISPVDSPLMQNADTVENGAVTGFAEGVEFDFAQNATVSKLTLSDDAEALATTFAPTSGVTVTDSTILNCAGVLSASLELSDLAVTHTRITAGSIFLSQVGGPIKFDADQLTNTPVTFDNQGSAAIADSKLTNSPVVSRFFFGGDVLENNTFTGAATALDLLNEFNETVTGNRFTNNDIGLKVEADVSGLGGNAVTANTFTGNKTAGALVDVPAGSGADIALTGNIATRNGASPDGTNDAGGYAVQGGLHVYLPGGHATIADNKTTRNSGFGIWAVAGSISGTGNVSVHDQLKCNPLTLCSY